MVRVVTSGSGLGMLSASCKTVRLGLSMSARFCEE